VPSVTQVGLLVNPDNELNPHLLEALGATAWRHNWCTVEFLRRCLV
jgi:hypothetical protein